MLLEDLSWQVVRDRSEPRSRKDSSRRRRRRRVGIWIALAFVIVTPIAVAASIGGPIARPVPPFGFAHNLSLDAGHSYTDGTRDGSNGLVGCASGVQRSSLEQIGVVGTLQDGLSQVAGGEVASLFATIQRSGPGPAVFVLRGEVQPDGSPPKGTGFYSTLWAQAGPGCLVAYHQYFGQG